MADFITKNIVSENTSPVGWVALDPLPVVGDPAAEVASFAAYHPAEIILPIAEALATEVGVAPQRALRWAAIWAVHQTRASVARRPSSTRAAHRNTHRRQPLDAVVSGTDRDVRFERRGNVGYRTDPTRAHRAR